MSSTPTPSNYPGNPSLPREVREKILSTFRHTLNLYQQGKTDDCVIGCDFILKMDPRFVPARKLMEKAKNPAADVDVAALESLVTATPTRQERVAAVDPDRLLVRAVESYNARDFDAVIAAAEQVLAVLPGNRDALEILDKAAGKKAAQPLFEASRRRALAALEAGRTQEAQSELVKMSELDSDHPAVALLERRLGVAPPAALGPPSSPPLTSGNDDEINFDLSSPDPMSFEHLGGATLEPEIRFDDGATVSLKLGGAPAAPAPRPATSAAAQPAPLAAAPTPPAAPVDPLDSLGLDSLSLDGPASPEAFSAQPMPPAQRMPLETPVQPMIPKAPPAPAPVPGSPSDLWNEGPESLTLEEPAPVTAPPASDFSSVAPTPPSKPLTPLVPIEEEDALASEREIASLLKQGDEAASGGDRQQAIEIWSRVFLIDINNAEAVTRIDRVRQQMAEGNRVISDGLKSGREKFEAGDLNAAREAFLEVLAIDPNEPTARFYIDRIEEGLPPGGAPGQSGASEGGALTEPQTVASGAAAGSTPAARASGRSFRLGVPPLVLSLVAVALVAVAAGVYFVLKAPRPVPGSRPAAAAAASSTGSLARAKQLADEGKTSEARKELLRVPANSPDFADARQMLSQLAASRPGQAEAPGASAAAPAVAALSGTPAAEPLPVATPGPNDPARLRAEGEKALTEKRYVDALKNLNLAAPAFRNDPTFAQSMGVAADKVAGLAPAIKLYNEGEYETAIPVLWRIHQDERDNQDARSYLLRSYYNLGITQLQNALYQKAMQSFDEALAIDPNDTEITRHRKFAAHYLKGDLDLMGRIYVRHLNHRS